MITKKQKDKMLEVIHPKNFCSVQDCRDCPLYEEGALYKEHKICLRTRLYNKLRDIKINTCPHCGKELEE